MSVYRDEDVKRYSHMDPCCMLGKSRFVDCFNPYGINSSGIPQRNGFAAWTYDIAMAFCLQPFPSGHAYMTRIDIERPILASSLHIVVGAAVKQNAELTGAAGIYDENLILRRNAVTPQSAFRQPGIAALDLDTPLLLLSNHSYYLALTLAGNSMPLLAALPVSAGLTAACGETPRAAVLPGCAENLPCSVSPHTFCAAPYFWMGVKAIADPNNHVPDRANG